MSKKVLGHPDKEEIIKKLLAGESVKSVEEWLNTKYPRKKRYHVSYMTLQKFRKEHLNLEGKVLDDLKNKRAEVVKDEEKRDLELEIKTSNAYQEKLNEIVDAEIDVTRRLLEMDRLINARLEYYYNVLQLGGDIKSDKIFLEYINTMRALMQDWKKYIEGFKDVRVENNINITVVNQQVTIIKQAVCNILQELQPEVIPIFIEKVNSELNTINLNEYSERLKLMD